MSGLDGFSSHHGAIPTKIGKAAIQAFKNDTAYRSLLLCGLSSCAKLSTICCSRCRNTFYCCDDHREEHWKLEGHQKNCVEVRAFDPERDPLPDTTGPFASPPEDLWDSGRMSKCFNIAKLHADNRGTVHGEHKLFFVKIQYPLVVAAVTTRGPSTVTVYDKNNAIKIVVRPDMQGYEELTKFDGKEVKNAIFRARRHGDFLRVYYDSPLFDMEWLWNEKPSQSQSQSK